MGCGSSARKYEAHDLKLTGNLSRWFSGPYLQGEMLDAAQYEGDCVDEVPTLRYDAADGPVHVWQHALDLRKAGTPTQPFMVAYHYSNELCFRNVGNLEQKAAELFASLVLKRAHFGQGVYATQHEPSVWESRLRILLNNYSNGDPWREDLNDEESQRVQQEFGDGNPIGHRAAFCIPMLVPMSMAYNIFERQTPDMKAEGHPVGTDYKGRAVHHNRDVWVMRVEENLSVQNATAKADGIVDLLQTRLRKWQALRGKDDSQCLGCMDELGRRLLGRGKFDEAEPYCRESSMSNLASLLELMGSLEEALELNREVLVKKRQVLGGQHHDVLTSMNNLGQTLQKMGRAEEAEPLVRECLAGLQATLGSTHAHTNACMNNLATLLLERGQSQEAELLYRNSLQERQEKLGDMHPDTLQGVGSLAYFLLEMKRFEEAEPLFREALERGRAKLGDLHPQSLSHLENLAGLLLLKGELDEAEQLFKEGLDKKQKQLGDLHPNTLTSKNNLAGLMWYRGNTEEAEQLWRSCLSDSRSVIGDLHPHTLSTMHNLAEVLHSSGNVEEAEKLLRECLSGRRTVLGEMHENTLSSIYNLARVLKAKGSREEAEQLFREELAKCRETRGDEDHETRRSMRNLAKLLEEMGQLDEAARLRNEAGGGEEACEEDSEEG